MPTVRRLAAILAADVAGYSRLMGADEEGTHERLQAHFRELVNPKIPEHRGRIVKNTGDGFLAEFQSVVDAVRCGTEIQRGMAERNAAIPADQRIEFRIGINLGDVIVEEHDIFGDGVNVAARLEGRAEYASAGLCAIRCGTDWASRSRTSVCRASRISHARFGTAPMGPIACQERGSPPGVGVENPGDGTRRWEPRPRWHRARRCSIRPDGRSRRLRRPS